MSEQHKVSEYVTVLAALIIVFAVVHHIGRSICEIYTKTRITKEEEAKKRNEQIAEEQKVAEEKKKELELDRLMAQITQRKRGEHK